MAQEVCEIPVDILNVILSSMEPSISWQFMKYKKSNSCLLCILTAYDQIFYKFVRAGKKLRFSRVNFNYSSFQNIILLNPRISIRNLWSVLWLFLGLSHLLNIAVICVKFASAHVVLHNDIGKGWHIAPKAASIVPGLIGIVIQIYSIKLSNIRPFE